jgi:hypothetical protein
VTDGEEKEAEDRRESMSISIEYRQCQCEVVRGSSRRARNLEFSEVERF